MPRYYFDFTHQNHQLQQHHQRDGVGSELSDDEAAQIEGVQAAAGRIKDHASPDGISLILSIRRGDEPLNEVRASITVIASSQSLEQTTIGERIPLTADAVK
jgi:hypothetical protein